MLYHDDVVMHRELGSVEVSVPRKPAAEPAAEHIDHDWQTRDGLSLDSILLGCAGIIPDGLGLVFGLAGPPDVECQTVLARRRRLRVFGRPRIAKRILQASERDEGEIVDGIRVGKECLWPTILASYS